MMNALMSGGRGRGDEGEAWHVVAEVCCIRVSADENARVVAQLDCGSSIRVDSAGCVSRRSPSDGGLAATRLFEQTRGFEWLRVTHPNRGWCDASECCVGDYSDLGSKWRFVVVCGDGALVREGLGLTSSLLYTLNKNAVFEVRERRVNDEGLMRLRSDDGWISEFLNPLSGQRGPIAQLLPFRRPMSYRVVLPVGAVVRATVELSSPIVHVVQCGEIVRVDDKQFSDHPAQHSVPRLRLAHPVVGWISERLNRQPPNDHAVVEVVGVCPPSPPSLVVPPVVERASSSDDSHNTNNNNNNNNKNGSNDRRRTTDAINGQTLCVVCLSTARNATFVHGETGHIACCLTCARALKARGDSCPVCRTGIDTVIQHFWA